MSPYQKFIQEAMLRIARFFKMVQFSSTQTWRKLQNTYFKALTNNKSVFKSIQNNGKTIDLLVFILIFSFIKNETTDKLKFKYVFLFECLEK